MVEEESRGNHDAHMEGMLKSIMDCLSKLEKGEGKKNVVWDENLEDNYEDTEWDEHDKAEYE